MQLVLQHCCSDLGLPGWAAPGEAGAARCSGRDAWTRGDDGRRRGGLVGRWRRGGDWWAVG
eukprot:1329386-Rhodomonas_salina.1